MYFFHKKNSSWRTLDHLLRRDFAGQHSQLAHLQARKAGAGRILLWLYPDRVHDMRSASKTVAPMLIGIARDQGVKLGLDSAVYQAFPQYKPFANWDDRKTRLTLGNLITMTSGYACDDNDDASPGNEDVMQIRQHSQTGTNTRSTCR